MTPTALSPHGPGIVGSRGAKGGFLLVRSGPADCFSLREGCQSTPHRYMGLMRPQVVFPSGQRLPPLPDWAQVTILQTWPMHLSLPGWPSPLPWCSSDGLSQPGQSYCLLLLETQGAHQAPRSFSRSLYQPQCNRLSLGVCREASGCRILMPGHSPKAPSPL